MMTIPTELSMHTLWDDLTQVLRRRKGLVTLTAILMALFVYGALSFMGDKYEAHASLLVKLGRVNAEVPLTVEKGGVFTDGVRKEEINSYVSLLKSRPLLAATIDRVGAARFADSSQRPTALFKRLKWTAKQVVKWGKTQLNSLLIAVGLRPQLEERELLILLLEKSLSVALEKDTNVITLSVRLNDPTLAKELLETLIALYLERHIELVQQETSVAAAFDQQVTQDRQQLKSLQEKRDRIRQDRQIGAIKEQQQQLATRMSTLESEILQAQRTLEERRAEKEELLSQSRSVATEVLTSQVLKPSLGQQTLRNRFIDLEISRAQKAAQFTPGAPALRMLEDEIRFLQSASSQSAEPEASERVYSRNPLLTQLESRLLSVELEQKALTSSVQLARTQREELAARLLKLNAAQSDLQMLDLEVEVAEKRFLTHASRQQEARAQELLNTFQIANISVLSPPTFSWKPVAPKRLFIMLGGVIGGVALGLGLALFLEWQNQHIRDPEDLQNIAGVPYLGPLEMRG